MIVFLKGKIQNLSANELVLDVNGVGYECLITSSTYDNLINNHNNTITILIYHHITEATQKLFGFLNENEKTTFKLLISVSGIGPKTAIQLLSSVSAQELENRIKTGEVGLLTSISGIGPKTAKRIIIELKEKFISLDENEMPIEEDSFINSNYKDAQDALIVLGYNRRETHIQLSKIAKKNKSIDTSEIIKLALSKIGKK